jgi:hypothetical protein
MMIKRIASLIAIPSILILGSCATGNSTAQLSGQNDDVYYSVAQAKEASEVIPQAQAVENKKSDYVTDEELYGSPYYDSYASRIYRFRDYAPWRSYYSDIYNFYDPFYSYRPGININFGYWPYSYYNPWRPYGYGYYGNNFWGPYSYYNYWPSYYGYYPGLGYGGYYGGGYGIGSPGYTSPNYRPRPVRSSDSFPANRGSVNGGATPGINRSGNRDAIQSSGNRAGRLTEGNSRPQSTAPRPERVNRAQPQRVSQPERIQSRPEPAPSNNNGGNSGRSSSGSSSSGARPSRN